MDIITLAMSKKSGGGITPEQLAQIEQNKNDISRLSEEIGDLSQLSAYGSSVTEILLKLISGGTITPEENAILESYNIFVPQNVSDEWNTGEPSGKTLDISTEEFLELFYDGFVTTPPDGMTVTKTSIGKDKSGSYDMWEYDFKPTNYSRTILLSSGMHTYELSASFGLANFIGHLYTDTGNEAFDYIRKNVRVKVVPIINPWGFNQSPKTYGNVDGVNPNRNFDFDGVWSSFPVYTPSQNEWNVKGEHPFSEAETRNLAKWVLDNWNAEFWIDCHTGLGYSDKDLWIYYLSDSVILNGIDGAVSKIEAWFKETYGSDCVTTRTIDSAGSIRHHWSNKIAGIPTMTLEQAPERTTFGTSNNNDSGDISNYSTNISTFVQEFLLEKYRDNTSIPITNVSVSDVTMASDELSKTVEATVTPTNTTQNHFLWESSDESVVEVYGGTNKAVLVSKGTGKAVLTLINRHNSSIVASFNVTVGEETDADTEQKLLARVNLANGNTSDSSGNGNDATISGTYTSDERGVVLDGTDGIINSNINLSEMDDWSIKCRFIPTASPDYTEYIASAYVDSNNSLIVMRYESTAVQYKQTADGTVAFDSGRISYGVSFGVENELVIVKNGTKTNLYVNGKQLTSGLTIMHKTNATICFGNRETTLDRGLVGVICDYEIYNYALTIDQPDLSCAICGLSATDGQTIEATNRLTTDFIPYDATTTNACLFDGYVNIVLRGYDSNYEYVETLTSGWLSSPCTIYEDAVNDSVKYVRAVLRNADDSDITTPISGTITIGNTTYELVLEE